MLTLVSNSSPPEGSSEKRPPVDVEENKEEAKPRRALLGFRDRSSKDGSES